MFQLGSILCAINPWTLQIPSTSAISQFNFSVKPAEIDLHCPLVHQYNCQFRIFGSSSPRYAASRHWSQWWSCYSHASWLCDAMRPPWMVLIHPMIPVSPKQIMPPRTHNCLSDSHNVKIRDILAPWAWGFSSRTLLWLAVEPTPLKNGVSNSWDDSFFPIWWKNKKCSKPPTSADWDNDISWYIVWATHIFHVSWFILTVQEEQTWMPIWSQPSNLKIGVKFLVQQTVHENDVHSPVFWWLTAHSNCVLNPISSVLWQWNPSSP